MERRMLLAVVLSFFVVMLYGTLTGQCTPPPKKPKTTNGQTPPGQTPQPGTTPAAAQPGVAPGTQPQPAAPPPPQPAPPPEEAGPQKDYVPPEIHTTVTTDELEVGFTTRGGAIAWIRLRNAYGLDRKTPLDLIVPTMDTLLLGDVDTTLVGAKGDGTFPTPKDVPPGAAGRTEPPPGPMRRWHWTRDEAAEEKTPEKDVIYTFTTASGVVWRKRWVLPDGPERYDVHLLVSRTAPAGQTLAATPLKVLVAGGLLREPSTGASYQYPNYAVVRTATMSEAKAAKFGLPLPNEDVHTADLRLLGARTHYFLTGYYLGTNQAPPSIVRWWSTGEPQAQRKQMIENVGAFFKERRGRDPAKDEALRARIQEGISNLNLSWLVIDVPPSGEVELPIYVGPIARHVLGQDVYASVKPIIQYPMAPDILADALLGIYDIFRSLLGNAGIAVILMTLVVRGLMMPLSIRNQLMMRRYSRKIAKIKPKLDALKKKFGHNLKKMREEQAKLYQEHGIGFPAGCLMLFIQLPIFFALFSALRGEYTLRNAPFLWIGDLSGPDKLIDFGHTVLNLGPLTIFSLNILPLLMVVLSIWQQKTMPKPADEQQAQQMRMMKWLPIIFAVILYDYTAALSLYMVLSSAMAIVESRIVRHRDREHDATPEQAWPGAAPA